MHAQLRCGPSHSAVTFGGTASCVYRMATCPADSPHTGFIGQRPDGRNVVLGCSELSVYCSSFSTIFCEVASLCATSCHACDSNFFCDLENTGLLLNGVEASCDQLASWCSTDASVRYICPSTCGCGFCPSPTPPAPPLQPACSASVELVLVIDRSHSMRGVAVEVLDAASAVAAQFLISDTDTRVGVIAFDRSARVVAGLSTSADTVHTAVNSIGPQTVGATNISGGLLEAAALLADARAAVPMMVVLLSDGGTQAPEYGGDAAAIAASLTVKSELGASLLAVALGARAQHSALLEAIASSPSSAFAHRVASTLQLRVLLSDGMLCSLAYSPSLPPSPLSPPLAPPPSLPPPPSLMPEPPPPQPRSPPAHPPCLPPCPISPIPMQPPRLPPPPPAIPPPIKPLAPPSPHARGPLLPSSTPAVPPAVSPSNAQPTPQLVLEPLPPMQITRTPPPRLPLSALPTLPGPAPPPLPPEMPFPPRVPLASSSSIDGDAFETSTTVALAASTGAATLFLLVLRRHIYRRIRRSTASIAQLPTSQAHGRTPVADRYVASADMLCGRANNLSLTDDQDPKISAHDVSTTASGHHDEGSPCGSSSCTQALQPKPQGQPAGVSSQHLLKSMPQCQPAGVSSQRLGPHVILVKADGWPDLPGHLADSASDDVDSISSKDATTVGDGLVAALQSEPGKPRESAPPRSERGGWTGARTRVSPE